MAITYHKRGKGKPRGALLEVLKLRNKENCQEKQQESPKNTNGVIAASEERMRENRLSEQQAIITQNEPGSKNFSNENKTSNLQNAVRC